MSFETNQLADSLEDPAPWTALDCLTDTSSCKIDFLVGKTPFGKELLGHISKHEEHSLLSFVQISFFFVFGLCTLHFMKLEFLFDCFFAVLTGLSNSVFSSLAYAEALV